MNNNDRFASHEISEFELDLLLLYYNFSDQWGKVDTEIAANFALGRFGILLSRDSFTIEQRHLDLLMDAELIPDVRLLFNKILMNAPKKRKKRSGKTDI